MRCKLSLYIAQICIYIYKYIYLLYSVFFPWTFPNKDLFSAQKKTHLATWDFLVWCKKSSKNILPNGGKANAKSANSPFSQIQEKSKDSSPQSPRFFGLSNDKGAFEQMNPTSTNPKPLEKTPLKPPWRWIWSTLHHQGIGLAPGTRMVPWNPAKPTWLAGKL